MNLGFIIHSELGSKTRLIANRTGCAAFSATGWEGSTSYDLIKKQKQYMI
jgi:hypothetical protein